MFFGAPAGEENLPAEDHLWEGHSVGYPLVFYNFKVLGLVVFVLYLDLLFYPILFDLGSVGDLVHVGRACQSGLRISLLEVFKLLSVGFEGANVYIGVNKGSTQVYSVKKESDGSSYGQPG